MKIIYCSQCGEKVDENDKYCSNCGTELKKSIPDETKKEKMRDEEDIRYNPSETNSEFKKSGCFKFFLGFLIIIGLIGVLNSLAINENQKEVKDKSEQKVVAEQKKEQEKAVNYDYEIMSEWKPHNKSNGLGLDLVLNEQESDLIKEDLISFIKNLSKDNDPVAIRVYLSEKAYNDVKNNNYTYEFDHGYLLYYIKNNSNNANEIRWMQEKGDFSDLFGTQTEI